MPGLDSLIGLSSVAEQLFVWGVLESIIAELMKPYLQAIDNRVLAGDPNVPLTPAQLAGMVVRGHISQSDAESEAKQSGISPDRLQRMVANYGNPPGPEALAEALRRNIIPEGQVGDETPSYLGGIAQGDLQNMWADVLTKLDLRLPGPTAAVTAAVRNMIAAGDGPGLYKLFGGDPQYYDLEYNITGEGPTPVEAGVLLNRGIIPATGLGPNSTSFEQAVSESRFKDKWSPIYEQLRFYRPPPRTVTAMYREGSLDENQATQALKDYGVPAEFIPAYVNKNRKSAVQTAHEITESNITKLYTERALTKAEATQHLVDIGYSAADAELILTSADLAWQVTLTNATIAQIKAAYLHRHIDRNGAITDLDARGVNSTYRDSLIALWDLEIQTGVKQLTVKQILDIWGVGLVDKTTATTMLEQAGYSDRDAGLLIALNDPSASWNTGPTPTLSNPGG